ncbi:ankyrin repeat domain-containing protein [Paracerasibacillus soli]|uniref:Uncharacterized protein n=1 Tax=Paracerasibacillus soli TaxID=480284 RepID=A0ABU5CM22_9BACI|nr:hypothetical protein [Virgibacillus soli]MDY0407386.1 hypothetical protein [Virgibacillus soli]
MDRLGRTPLQVACYFGFYPVTRTLLENGTVIVKGVFSGSKMVGMGIPNMK